MRSQSEPHLGNDEEAIRLAASIVDHPDHQQVVLILPPDENVVQELPEPRSGVHPSYLLPHRKAKEAASQEEAVFYAGLQKESITVAALGVHRDTEGTNYNQLVHLRTEPGEYGNLRRTCPSHRQSW
ncbi:hypothetical protein SprV_0401570500 [Sparganum proliferum]